MNNPHSFWKAGWMNLAALICSLAALVCSIFCLVRLSDRPDGDVQPPEFPESKNFFTAEEAASYLGLASEDLDALVKWAYLNPDGSNTYHLPVVLENGAVYYTRDFLDALGYIDSPAYIYEEWPPVWPPDPPETDLY